MTSRKRNGVSMLILTVEETNLKADSVTVHTYATDLSLLTALQRLLDILSPLSIKCRLLSVYESKGDRGHFSVPGGAVRAILPKFDVEVIEDLGPSLPRADVARIEMSPMPGDGPDVSSWSE